MRPRGLRFLGAGTAIFLGASLVWLSAAVPFVAGATEGSALSAGPEGLSTFAGRIRDRGLLAQSVRIDETAEGIGLTPLPWTAWSLRPQDAVLSARSDVPLTPAEVSAGRAWLEAGGLLVLVAETPQEVAMGNQLLGRDIANAPMFDGAFSGSPDRPIIPDGDLLYQLDGAMVVAGGDSYLGSAGLSWMTTPTPGSANALQPFAFAARFAVGQGAILVLGDSHPLSNAGLVEWDDAQLADRIVDELASGGGVVYIDEGHRSATGSLRIDLVLRAIDANGRIAIVAIVAVALAMLLFSWPARLGAALRRRLIPPEAAAPDAGPAAVLAQHPGWDPRILDRLWSGNRP